MSLRNFIKKHGKRIAGTWGRVNHKKDKRACGKGIRRLHIDEDIEPHYDEYDTEIAWEQHVEMFEQMEDLIIDEEPH